MPLKFYLFILLLFAISKTWENNSTILSYGQQKINKKSVRGPAEHNYHKWSNSGTGTKTNIRHERKLTFKVKQEVALNVKCQWAQKDETDETEVLRECENVS